MKTEISSTKRAPKPSAPPDTAMDTEMHARLRKAAETPDEEINLYDPDAPEVVDWAGAERGRFYRPVKRLKSFRIDADVLAYFAAQGRGYQAEVNRVLREAMIRGRKG